MSEVSHIEGRGLRELSALFLRIGVTSFGGPVAHIAVMRDELVRRRGWMTDREFMDAAGAVNLIPGPNSTELAIHAGRRRAGWPGLAVAGLAFILPAAVLTGLLAWLYVRYGTTVAADNLLYGVKPVMIAVIAVALWGLRRAAVTSVTMFVIGAAVLALALWPGINELALLFGGGGVALGLHAAGNWRRGLAPAMLPVLLLSPSLFAAPWQRAATAVMAAGQPFTVWGLFLSFLKIGSVLYGSGYVLLAFMKSEFVDRLGWLTDQQLLDAIAAGQVTPGPVFSTATFAGYVTGGAPGAVLATVGIFLPAFVFVAALGWVIGFARRHDMAGAFLNGVNAASLGLMAAVAYQLARASMSDPVTVICGVTALGLLVRTKLNSAWLIGAGGLAGLAYRYAS